MLQYQQFLASAHHSMRAGCAWVSTWSVHPIVRDARRTLAVATPRHRRCRSSPARGLSAHRLAEGFAVALDGLSADVDWLALPDVLAPDIGALDLALAQSLPHYRHVRTRATVLARHEHAGTKRWLKASRLTNPHVVQCLWSLRVPSSSAETLKPATNNWPHTVRSSLSSHVTLTRMLLPAPH